MSNPTVVQGIQVYDGGQVPLPSPPGVSTLTTQAGQLMLTPGGSSTPAAVGGGGGFGSDTIVQLPNASAQQKTVLELIAAYISNVAGSESSNWVLKVLTAGAQAVAATFSAAQAVFPNGSAAAPGVAFAGDPSSGVYRQGVQDNRLVDAGNGVVRWNAVDGLFMLLAGTALHWANAVGYGQGGANSANAIITTATNGCVEIGAAGALATNATAGFLSPPSCAGTPTGTVANVSTGKVPMVVDTTGNKVWFQVSAGVWKGVVIA